MGVIPRDGTGPEVIAEGLKVLEAVAETADMEYNIVHYGLVELTRESRMRIHVRK
jgi:3-isopropylmalate dehydrogenase